MYDYYYNLSSDLKSLSPVVLFMINELKIIIQYPFYDCLFEIELNNKMYYLIH